MLIDHPSGRYRFLPGGRPYSSGAVACAGYEVRHAVLRVPISWREGFEVIDQHLALHDASRQALCGVELRCRQPHTIDGFASFNEAYRSLLESWELLVDGVNPVARTNVSPARAEMPGTMLYGFSFVVPSSEPGGTFVVAGAGEVRSADLSQEAIVRFGETSEAAVREKAEYVIDVMEKRMSGLGVGWGHATAVNVYTVHAADGVLSEVLVPRIGAAVLHGVRRQFARPPVAHIEFEMDVRGYRHEAVVG